MDQVAANTLKGEILLT
jgi:hypothetical protein